MLDVCSYSVFVCLNLSSGTIFNFFVTIVVTTHIVTIVIYSLIFPIKFYKLASKGDSVHRQLLATTLHESHDSQNGSHDNGLLLCSHDYKGHRNSGTMVCAHTCIKCIYYATLTLSLSPQIKQANFWGELGSQWQ